jgi:hypothetical protein
MAWSFNPFTGNLDITGSSGAVVFEGEVETFADLPETIGDPAVGASFLVRSSTGVWLVNRRQAGIWIRRNNTGVRATDWEYGGDYPVNSVNGQTGNVSLGSSDVAAEPIDYTVVTTAQTLINGAKVAADTTSAAWTLTLPATPSNGDTITVLDYAGTFDTNNLTIARNGSNIESLAEDMNCNVEDAAFALVYVGSTVGWKVVPYFGNKTNFASPDPIGSSVPNTGRFTTLTANNGTLTASAPVLDLAQTWNNAATTFTGLRLDITNTTSGSASRLLELLVGGVNRFTVTANASGSVPAPLISVGGSGFGWNIRTRTGGGVGCNFDSIVGISGSLQFGVASGTTAGDLILLRDDAANTLGQRNGTAAQTFRIYNTYTDASNFERGFLRWSSNILQIGTEKGSGGGTARALEFQTDGVTRVTISSGVGNISATNAVLAQSDCGLFNGLGVVVANGRFVAWTDGSTNSSTRDLQLNRVGAGILRVQSNTTDFNRINFGGDTTSFPALKRSSTALQVRLADDSAYSVMDAQLRAQGTAPATTGATGTAGDIRYDADYIYVCTAANTWKRAAIATW